MKLRDFFYLNRSDRGILSFFLMLGIVVLGLLWWSSDDDMPEALKPAETTARSSLSSPAHEAQTHGYYAQRSTRRAERFDFDPNTADSTTLLRLGLQPWQVRNIYKYRAAGGVYRRPSDFARLYGLTQKQYRELRPHIRISRDYAPASELVAGESRAEEAAAHAEPLPRSNKISPGEHIDLSTADTVALMRVPGIGSYFARRIVSYRERLGGFYSAEQLREIDDFPETALSFFVVSNKIHRLNVNTLRLGELKRHPYINYYQAKAICDYRRLRGHLTSLRELRLLPYFTDGDIARLTPYVTF